MLTANDMSRVQPLNDRDRYDPFLTTLVDGSSVGPVAHPFVLEQLRAEVVDNILVLARVIRMTAFGKCLGGVASQSLSDGVPSCAVQISLVQYRAVIMMMKCTSFWLILGFTCACSCSS